MKKLNTILIIGAACVGTLAGCSSSPDIADRLEAIQEAQVAHQEARAELEQDKREAELDVAPDWFLAPPEPDSVGFFGTGYAKSKNIGHALKSARLQAEFDLAKMYKQELSGSERAFERGNSQGDVEQQTTFLIDKIVDAVPVIGYTVVEQRMTPVDGVFEAFVLLKLPYDEFNKVLSAQRQQTLDKTVQASFDDLERRLVSRRTQREQAEQAAHEREMETVEQRARILKESTAAESAKSARAEDTTNAAPDMPTKPVIDSSF